MPIGDISKLLRRVVREAVPAFTENIPDVGKPPSLNFWFKVPGAAFPKCALCIREKITAQGWQLSLRFSALFPEDDRVMSHYLWSGTKAELPYYMQGACFIPDVEKSIREIDEAIRRHD